METSQSAPDPALSPKPSTKRSLLCSLMEAAVAATNASASLHRSPSFTVDSYLTSSLKPLKLKALEEVNQLLSVSPKPITLWGVPVAPAGGGASDDRADVVLLKFLCVRDFDAVQAHATLSALNSRRYSTHH